MPEQIAKFVAEMVARFGPMAYSVALEQASRAATTGAIDAAQSWTAIADGIATLPEARLAGHDVGAEIMDGELRATEQHDVRQLLYTSTAIRPADEDQLARILVSSSHNNVLNSVTGILWSDGDRFIQVLEGPSASVGETYERIMADDRHRDLVVVHDHSVQQRDFGSWSMCHRRSYETDGEYDRKIRKALAAVPVALSSTLHSFIGVKTE